VEPGKFLCKAETLIEGKFRELQANTGTETLFVIATRHAGVARAWLNVCPHQGRPLNWAPDRFLTDEHGHLVCAAHGAVFEPARGRCISGPCKNAELRAVGLTEINDKVYLTPP
jgi:nitrite reductase/ring-hydroxylating ferredoxin subunit